MKFPVAILCLLLCHSWFAAADEPAWTKAADTQALMSAEEAKAFMKTLAQHAVDHHMKKKEGAPQRGMMYEYVWWKKVGQPGQFVQGEALDTMHDGAWFLCAMAHAYRATGDPYYKEVIVKWQLSFYLKMLNESAKLFSNESIDVQPKMKEVWKESKEWLLQGREDGFVPYWWDDGESQSIEMHREKGGAPLYYPGTNHYAGKANPECLLDGYSHGSSNHLAQDLGVMLVQAWLTLKDSSDAGDKEFLKQIADAAHHLEECRTRHGQASIPAVLAAVALCTSDEAALKKLPAWDKDTGHPNKNHYFAAVRDFKADAKASTPGFADDQEYIYYAGVVKHHGMTLPLAYQLTLDAFTHPLLYALYSDDAPVPPGINRFDLYPYNFVNGKPDWLRSQRKGPNHGPVPLGSRFGPQNMVVCGWALQAMQHLPEGAALGGRVKDAIEGLPGADLHPDVKAWLEHELGGGLRTWEAIFKQYGYIPTGIGCHSTLPGTPWDEFSDNGGYAHLISAAAQWILYKEGKADWEKW